MEERKKRYKTEADRFEAMARRKNARLDNRYPLLAQAGLTQKDHVNAEQMREATERSVQRWNDRMARAGRAAARRARLAQAIMAPDGWAEAEEYRRRTYPNSHEFITSFWTRIIRLLLRDPSADWHPSREIAIDVEGCRRRGAEVVAAIVREKTSSDDGQPCEWLFVKDLWKDGYQLVTTVSAVSRDGARLELERIGHNPWQGGMYVWKGTPDARRMVGFRC